MAKDIILCGALLLAVCSALTGADAMTFTLERGRDGSTYIAARGDIVDGDAQRFAQLVPRATVDSRGLRHMVVGSDGGSVIEAKAIAEVIRAKNFFVVVDQDCASACAAILYPAGSHFMLLDGGRLGFHQCYDATNFRVVPECTKEIAEQAAAHGFPYGTLKVLAEMSGPAEMTWVRNVLTPCFGMEWLPGDPPPVSLALPCPHTGIILISANAYHRGTRVGPSFDCMKRPLSPMAELLCLDQELMLMDSLMGRLYLMMVRKRQPAERAELVQPQREWITRRDAACPITSEVAQDYARSRQTARCVSEQTIARMGELMALNGTPLGPLADLIFGERARKPQ